MFWADVLVKHWWTHGLGWLFQLLERNQRKRHKNLWRKEVKMLGSRRLPTSGLPYERPRATRALRWGAPQAADPPTPGPEKHQKSFRRVGESFLAGIRVAHKRLQLRRLPTSTLSHHHRTASPNLRAAAPAADPGSKYGGLATFGYLLKQGNLGTNLRNISIAPCES